MKRFSKSLMAGSLCFLFSVFSASPASGQNLLTDPDFESGGTAWQLSAGSGRSVVNTGAEHGTYCQQELMTGSAGTRRVWQDVTVTAGASYQASGWVNTAAVAAGSIVIFWFNSATPPQNFVATDYLRADTLGKATATAWTRQSGTYAAPATSLMARFYLLGEGTAGTVWFDNLSFTGPGSGIQESRIALSPLSVSARPNPFSRTIAFSSSELLAGISIYAMTGACVARLIPNSKAAPVWCPAATVPNGAYTADISFNNSRSISRQVILIR